MESISTGGLSPSQTSRAMQVFHVNAVLWAVWGVTSGIGTAVYTGYLLWMGATGEDIAYLTSMAFFVSLILVVSVSLARRTRNKKLFVVGCGSFEVLFRFLTVILPLIFATISYRITVLYVFVVIGLCFSYTASPTFSDWMAQIIPEKLRAKFTSQRTVANVLVTIVCGYLFGEFLDMFPGQSERYWAFAFLLFLGFVTGLGGYFMLLRSPIPDLTSESSEGVLDALADILRSKSFVGLLAFSILWQFVTGFSSPFITVFMLEDLQLSYATIAIYSNIALVVQVLSYHPLAGLISRFGSKPVIQVLLIPGILGHFLRVFAKKDCHYLLPVSFTLYSILGAAITVASTSYFYSLLPKKKDRTAHFAAWSAVVYLFGGIAPLMGGIVASRLKEAGFHYDASRLNEADYHYDYEWFGFPVGNYQIIFTITSVAMLGLLPLLSRIEERRAQSATWLLTQVWKGNPLAFLYNFLTMNVIGGESQRIRSAMGMASSGSPLAGEELIKAMTDLSPAVRRKAVEGLAILGSEDAVGPLIQQLADKESDLRAEAAEALGKIGHPLALDALLDALGDEDPRVRVSAIRALGDIGGPGVQELLYSRLTQFENRRTFPTIIDVLSRMGDGRVVAIALQRLQDYDSPVLRAQILNSVCRALGAGEDFYRLAIMDELQQAARIGAALVKARKDLAALHGNLLSLRDPMAERIKEVLEFFERGKPKETFAALTKMANGVIEAIRELRPDLRAKANFRSAQAASDALILLNGRLKEGEIGSQEFVFAVVCMSLSLRALKEAGAEKVTNS